MLLHIKIKKELVHDISTVFDMTIQLTEYIDDNSFF